ncbi:hypothetical protein EXU57_01530 [Segetibacter sp. 3557_3]|uniref:hypothetical protein n=1 Tax=Segetibacter sp. 3557_3 TaxID=2547429 RepID=UPI0010587AAB|nr:hypothetical protein [Segetibacter sp. 3557_3]TDH28778.1 hypothetical protein EXU57_01530 [Segetibacter sp. 3557_3]
MVQPFVRFKPEYINRLLLLKKIYLVSQSYKRITHPPGTEKPTGLLLTDYDDPGLGKTHLNAIKTDPMAYLLNLANEAHLLKIKELLAGNKYVIYWSVVEDPTLLRKTLDFNYKDHIRRFVLANTNWRIGADEQIRASMQVIFGELFIILKRGNQTMRVKFEEIERL